MRAQAWKYNTDTHLNTNAHRAKTCTYIQTKRKNIQKRKSHTYIQVKIYRQTHAGALENPKHIRMQTPTRTYKFIKHRHTPLQNTHIKIQQHTKTRKSINIYVKNENSKFHLNIMPFMYVLSSDKKGVLIGTN